MTKTAYKYYVGIDIAKNKLDVVISSNNDPLEFKNDLDGFKGLTKKLPAKKTTLIILEASGGYEKVIAHFLRTKKFNVAIVNAKRVRDFAKAAGRLAKTDRIDAKIIMDFGKAFNPTPQALVSSEEDQRLQDINRRAQIVKMITIEKQHLEQSSAQHKKAIKKHINYLEKELVKIESLLKQSFNQDPVLQDKLVRLDAIKGVGEVTAMNVLIHLPELGQLTHKEISALAGVAPFNKDSGQMKKRRQIHGGRAAVRAALYMAALSAKKSNAALRQFYDQLIARGKLKKVALVACMRKLIIIMNAMMRDNTLWRSTY